MSTPVIASPSNGGLRRGLAARMAMFAGGKKLPYDHKVAWIMSKGQHYIDTEIVFESSHGFKVEYSPIAEGTNVDNFAMFGSRTDSGNTRLLLGCNANTSATRSIGYKVYIGWGGNVISASESKLARIGNWYQASCNAETKNAYDGLGSVSAIGTLPSQTRTAYIFAANTNNGVLKGYGKIRCVTIYKNNLPIINLVPVRKDGLGYLYDEESGDLYGFGGKGGVGFPPSLVGEDVD